MNSVLGVDTRIGNYIAKEVQDWAEVREFKLDMKTKSATLAILPKGEKKGIIIEVIDFSVEADSGKYFLAYEEILISREWLKILADKYLPDLIKDKRIELPNTLGFIANILV